MTPTVIDWARLGAGGFSDADTDLALDLADREHAPWRRSPRAGQHGKHLVLADGRVTIDNTDPLLPPPRWRPVDAVHPNLVRAMAFVERWPEAARQWPRLVHTLQGFWDTDASAGPLRSASHSEGARLGVFALTLNCPLASAQAIVHEAAHNKLRALGVDNESAVRIVANPPDQRFRSPVVLDRLRPMTAVLHALYSFLHVLQLDLLLLKQETDAAVRDDLLALIGRNLPRIEDGIGEVRRNIRVDEAGAGFLEGLTAWSAAVIAEARDVLAREPAMASIPGRTPAGRIAGQARSPSG